MQKNLAKTSSMSEQRKKKETLIENTKQAILAIVETEPELKKLIIRSLTNAAFFPLSYKQQKVKKIIEVEVKPRKRHTRNSSKEIDDLDQYLIE